MTALNVRTAFGSDRWHPGDQVGSPRTFPRQETHVSIVRVKGSVRAPVTSELRQVVDAIIRRGGRRVLLDLAGLRDIDAAGVGELVCAYNVMTAAGGILQIAHANRFVRRVLEIVGLFELLTAGTDAPPCRM